MGAWSGGQQPASALHKCEAARCRLRVLAPARGPANDGLLTRHSSQSTPDCVPCCLEMGAFPMEFLYRPLFSGTQMRLLFVRFFRYELHFKGDEMHTYLALQVPKFGPVLNKVLKKFSS